MYEELEKLNGFLVMARTASSGFDKLCSMVKACENELMDIQHEIELTAPDRNQKAKLCTRQQVILKKRRGLKNQVEFIRPLYDFLCKQQSLVPTLEKVMLNMREKVKLQEVRVYHCKAEDRVISREVAE